MNLTVVSLLLALGQPIIHSAYKNYLIKKKEEALKEASFTLIHKLKGRRRYKSVLLKDPDFGLSLQRKFEGLNFILSVDINAITGTMLLTYNSEESVIDELMCKLNEETDKVTNRKLHEEQDYGQEKTKGHGGFGTSNFDKAAMGAMSAISAYGIGQGVKHLGQKSILGSTVNKYTHNINSLVHDATGGITDLGTMVGMLSLTWGIYKIFVDNQKPNGPQLLWWGYKLLEGH